MTGWNPEIVATVDKVIVDAVNRSVTFQLEEGHAPNMTGTIKCAVKLLPEVVTVVVLSGDNVQTVYTPMEEGWAALNPKKMTINRTSWRWPRVQG